MVAVVAVGGASALLVACDADLVVAALCLLGVVVVTAVMGLPSAATAVVASYLALNYWFTPPLQSLEITKAQDLVPLLAFTSAAAASAATVARVHWLRQRRAHRPSSARFDARVAQATSDSRAAFLASMTHNLRTPLATIKASISALLAIARRRPAPAITSSPTPVPKPTDSNVWSPRSSSWRGSTPGRSNRTRSRSTWARWRAAPRADSSTWRANRDSGSS